MDDYAAWLPSLPSVTSANTVGHFVATVRAAMNQAKSAGIIRDYRVGRWLTPKAEPVERKILESFSELRRALDAIRAVDPQDVWLPAAWMAFTGNRPSSTVRLEWGHVDIDRAHVRRVEVKQRSLRQYPLTGAAVELLRSTPRRHERLVFARERDGRPWTTAALYHQFTQAVMRSSLDYHMTPYTLRHTFASLMANEIGCPVNELQVMMGHTSITVTAKYLHSTGAASARAAFTEALKGL